MARQHIPEAARRVAVNVVEKQEIDMGAWYHQVCAYYGALCLAGAIGDTPLRDRVAAAYSPYLHGEKQPMTDHVDNNLFGILPFELYRQTGDSAYLPLARYLADEEFAAPRADGLTRYARFWVDDTYMVGSLQAQAFRALGDPCYADRAAHHLLAYSQRLQRQDGLFEHLPGTPVVWARGCGWVAAGMAEVLLALPADHPGRQPLLAAFRRLADALLEHQAANGMWLQVVDEPDAWPEVSGTGMYTFALATGAREGWGDTSAYGRAAERAWKALTAYIDPAGHVSETSRGVDPRGATLSDYLGAPHLDDDYHGLAAVLWAAVALVKLTDGALA